METPPFRVWEEVINTLYLYAFIALVVGVVLGVLLSGSGLPQGKAISQPSSAANIFSGLKIYQRTNIVWSNETFPIRPFAEPVTATCPTGTYAVTGGCEVNVFQDYLLASVVSSTPLYSGSPTNAATVGWNCNFFYSRPYEQLPSGVAYSTVTTAWAFCK
ncbi:hypothetical protein HZB02_01925 [Candidatus Woesearchaeota archaeon]|nr:hypothetical protein [Candidatus Woesearchaeota archaeon]